MQQFQPQHLQQVQIMCILLAKKFVFKMKVFWCSELFILFYKKDNGCHDEIRLFPVAYFSEHFILYRFQQKAPNK